MAADRTNDDTVTLITWALDRILNAEYVAIHNEAGAVERMELDRALNPQNGPINLEAVEGALNKILPPGEWDALCSLKVKRAPEDIERVLRLILPSFASLGAKELDGAEWRDVLLFIHVHLTDKDGLGEKIGELLVKEREGFSSGSGRNIETILEREVPEALSLFTARRYAKEIRNLFPKIVRRADSLRLLPADTEVPEFVCRYLVEASRCYIYGHFLASLFLCRSAIEEAVEDRLRSKGFGRDMVAVRDEWLKGILMLARNKNLLEEAFYYHAEDVRILANKAIHGSKLPTNDECREAFDLTRGVLQHLYA